MGTRADFYVGKGKHAEWIGSIAWDGYRVRIDSEILNCTDEQAFRNAVKSFLDERDDATYPNDGWPWPWATSETTDCHYWFFDNQCWEGVSDYSRYCDVYVPANVPEPEFNEVDPDDVVQQEQLREQWLSKFDKIEFPDMKDKQNVTFGKRSGVIFIGVDDDR